MFLSVDAFFIFGYTDSFSTVYVFEADITYTRMLREHLAGGKISSAWKKSLMMRPQK